MRKCQESVEIKNKFFERYADQIGELSQKMAERFSEGRRLWVMGNGGSACDAQHVAVEFIHPIIEKAAGSAGARSGQPDIGGDRDFQ